MNYGQGSMEDVVGEVLSLLNRVEEKSLGGSGGNQLGMIRKLEACLEAIATGSQTLSGLRSWENLGGGVVQAVSDQPGCEPVMVTFLSVPTGPDQWEPSIRVSRL